MPGAPIVMRGPRDSSLPWMIPSAPFRRIPFRPVDDPGLFFFPDGVQKPGKNSEKREGSASPQAASRGALLPAGKQAWNQPPSFAEAKTSGKRGAAALAGKVPLKKPDGFRNWFSSQIICFTCNFRYNSNCKTENRMIHLRGRVKFPTGGDRTQGP